MAREFLQGREDNDLRELQRDSDQQHRSADLQMAAVVADNALQDLGMHESALLLDLLVALLN